MGMKTETWNDHKIRFVEVNGEWWAVAKDISVALGYKHTPHMIRILDAGDKGVHKVDTLGGTQELSIVSEFGIYDAIFNSRKPEAKEFKRWVYDVIKTLRQSTGLEGFQVFRMLDKEHQREAMNQLKAGLSNPVKVDYIKANTIANKAVSTAYGYPKMVKKSDMSPEMLMSRQEILDNTVGLMVVNEKLGLGLSVSEAVYEKYKGDSRMIS